MLIDPPLDWTSQDESNFDFLKRKYQDREAMGEEWITKHKDAERNKIKEDGKPNPQYPRMAMEANIARMQFEYATIIARLDIMEHQQEIMAGLFQRVGILEGAYQSLAVATQTVKVDYSNRLGTWLAKNKPRVESPPPRPRAVGEIVAEDFETKPKEQENGSTTRTES